MGSIIEGFVVNACANKRRLNYDDSAGAWIMLMVMATAKVVGMEARGKTVFVTKCRARRGKVINVN